MIQIRHPEEEKLISIYDYRAGFSSSLQDIKPIFQELSIILNEKSKVLDLGCGHGAITNQIRKDFGCQIIGVDFSLKRIQLAKKNSDVEYVYEDIYNYVEKTNNKYDLILLFEVLEHLKEPKSLLNSTTKLLTEAGQIIGSVPIKSQDRTHLQYFEDIKDIENKLGVKVIFEKMGGVIYFKHGP